MITKKLNRYYCEYCKKSGCNANVIRKHESACTLNPNRVCRVCLMDHGDSVKGEGEQKPIIDLMALLPDPLLFLAIGEYDFKFYKDGLTETVNSALPLLREVSGDCPACIMAALRQKGIPVLMATDFSFTKEMKEIWDNINDKNRSC